MPRKKQIMVPRRRELTPGRKYLVRLKDLDISKSPPGLAVEVQFVTAEQFGRREIILLPPVYADSSTAEMFRSIGMEVVENQPIELYPAVGRLMYIVFDTPIPDIPYHNVTFTAYQEKKDHGQIR